VQEPNRTHEILLSR